MEEAYIAFDVAALSKDIPRQTVPDFKAGHAGRPGGPG
jgi:hypothetical protein